MQQSVAVVIWRCASLALVRRNSRTRNSRTRNSRTRNSRTRNSRTRNSRTRNSRARCCCNSRTCRA